MNQRLTIRSHSLRHVNIEIIRVYKNTNKCNGMQRENEREKERKRTWSTAINYSILSDQLEKYQSSGPVKPNGNLFQAICLSLSSVSFILDKSLVPCKKRKHEGRHRMQFVACTMLHTLICIMYMYTPVETVDLVDLWLCKCVCMLKMVSMRVHTHTRRTLHTSECVEKRSRKMIWWYVM